MSSVQIHTIHDRSGGLLAFDLKDILEALEPLLDRWTWHVGHLDTVSNAVPTAEPEGEWLSSRELTDFANAIAQTIDGTFIAYPKGQGARGVSEVGDLDELEIAFPTSLAELMIVATDSSYFEVYAKDPKVTELLRRRFKDVREKDAKVYF
jgi:hypothetical protein